LAYQRTPPRSVTDAPAEKGHEPGTWRDKASQMTPIRGLMPALPLPGFFYPQIGPYTRRLRLGDGGLVEGNPLCYPKRQPDLLDVAMANARAKGFASPIATSSDD